MAQSQAANHLFMVYPSSFGFDEQTAATNTFQHRVDLSRQAITAKAEQEFNAYVEKLEQYDIPVTIFRDKPAPQKPDAVFPNNWLGTWPDGRLILYPMATESRRIERSPAAVQLLKDTFDVQEVVDISPNEHEDKILESTGAIVFDHVHKIAYGCISPRCNEELFVQHATDLGYKPITFHAYDQHGVAIYHTNVLMGIQSRTAVICLEAIRDKKERRSVQNSLEETGHQVVAITLQQMAHFCGNVLEVQNSLGQHFLILSQTAYDAFTSRERAILGQNKTLLPVAIPTIEDIGGGSARCMIAEVFLPTK